jgi:hypothetical protein
LLFYSQRSVSLRRRELTRCANNRHRASSG